VIGEEGEGELGNVEEERRLRGLGGKFRRGFGRKGRSDERRGRIHDEGRVGGAFRTGEEDVKWRRVMRDSLREESIPGWKENEGERRIS